MKNSITLFVCLLASIGIVSSQGIQLAVNPTSRSVEIGSTVNFAVAITPTGGFNQQVQLSATSDLYIGPNNGEINIQFSPNNLFAPYTGGANMSVTVTSTIPLGSHWITVQAANGPVSATQTIPIEIIVDSCMWQKYGEPGNFFNGSAGMQKIVVDNNGVVWSGGCMGGFFKYDGSWTRYYDGNSNLPGIRVNDLAVAPDNSILIATERGLAKFDGTYWTIYDSTNSGLSCFMISSIDHDTNGDLWVGTTDYVLNQLVTAGNGVYKLSGNIWTHYNTSNSILPENRIKKVRADRYGNVYFLTAPYGPGGSRILKYDSAFHLVTPLDSISIQDFAIDTLGNLWLVTSDHTNNALLKYDGNTIEAWSYSGTTPYNHTLRNTGGQIILQDNLSYIPSTRIYAVYVDSRNIVWVTLYANNPNNANQGNGLFVMAPGGYTHFNSYNSSLPWDQVHGVVEKGNTVWIAGGWGELGGESPYKTVASMHCENIGRRLVSEVKEIGELPSFMNIYPNPADNILFIDAPLSGVATVNIYTATGELLRGIRQISSNSIDISGLPAGLYIAERKTERTVQRLRWVKM